MPPQFTDLPESDARLAVRYARGRQTLRVVLEGDLDLSTADRARAAIQQAQGEAQEVVCDLSAVRFIDVSGMCVLLDFAARARHLGGRLTVANPPAIAYSVFRLFGLHDAVETGTAAPLHSEIRESSSRRPHDRMPSTSPAGAAKPRRRR